MKQRVIAVFTAFIIFTSLICNTSLTVYASSTYGGGGTSRPSEETELNDWSDEDKAKYWDSHKISILGSVLGILFNVPTFSYDEWLNRFESVAADKITASGASSYEDYIIKKFHLDSDNNLIVEDELSDVMYQTTVEYINEYTGFTIAQTMDYRKLPTSKFATKTFYDSFMSYCKENLNGTNNILSVKFQSDGALGLGCGVLSDYVLVGTLNKDSLSNFIYNGITVYNSSWEKIVLPTYKFDIDKGLTPILLSSGEPLTSSAYLYFYRNSFDFHNGATSYTPLSDGVQDVRVYKTVEDMKSYSIGQRPYYVTDKFQDYDVNGDNSCVISESDLKNGSVYGDVYNYIINNYGDKADGLSEDELIKILSEYLGQNSGNTGGGTGGGSVSGNNNGGGGGLGGFLDGLGAIGDALLSILGKLMEYIGKAIELLSDTVMNIVEVIPQNITNLISALFPFIPKEWITAIELSLVLSVIIGIVRIFKK